MYTSTFVGGPDTSFTQYAMDGTRGDAGGSGKHGEYIRALALAVGLSCCRRSAED